MTEDEIIIYGFQLGNSDPDFQEFVKSLSNEDIHNLRKMLYESKLDGYRDGYGVAMYGKDRYGFVNIPQSIRKKRWEESGNELFDLIKNIWVASVLGFTNPGLNPMKQIQWTSTRARAVTSYDEGFAILSSVIIELALSYILRSKIKHSTNQYRYTIKEMRRKGKFDGFSISKGDGYGPKPRFDFHTLENPRKTRNSIPNLLKNRRMFHYHKGETTNILKRHRPWEKDPFDESFWDRFY